MPSKPLRTLEPNRVYWVCRACKNRRKKSCAVEHGDLVGNRMDGKCEFCGGWEFDLWPVKLRRSVLELLAEAADGPDETG